MSFVAAGFLVCGSEILKIANIVRISSARSCIMVYLKDCTEPVRLDGAQIQEVLDTITEHAAKQEACSKRLHKGKADRNKVLASSVEKLAVSISSSVGSVSRALSQNAPSSEAKDLDLLALTVRTANILRANGLDTLEKVRNYGQQKLLMLPGFGKRQLLEVAEVLESTGDLLPGEWLV